MIKYDTRPKGSAFWVKFEYFNWPIEPDSDFHESLIRYFNNVKKLYIDYNYIEGNKDTGQLDLESILVQQKYRILPLTAGQRLFERHKASKLKNNTLFAKNRLYNRGEFNLEELFYMNRVAFHLFR
mgnify:CR=1 FL=1